LLRKNIDLQLYKVKNDNRKALKNIREDLANSAPIHLAQKISAFFDEKNGWKTLNLRKKLVTMKY